MFRFARPRRVIPPFPYTADGHTPTPKRRPLGAAFPYIRNVAAPESCYCCEGNRLERELIVSPAELSSSEAERLRAFERQGHDALATSYHTFLQR